MKIVYRNIEFVESGDCLVDLYTFNGEGMSVDATIKDEIKDFDSGYKPHDYTETPDFAIGDTTWELIDCIFGDPDEDFEKFGETVKLSHDKLYVGTPSSKKQIVYVYEYGTGNCKDEWNLINKITKKSIWSLSNNIESVYETKDRTKSVLYPYQYIPPEQNKFGISIDVNERFVAIGDSIDRTYKNEIIHNEAGTVYLYEKTNDLKFLYKIYSAIDQEEEFTYRFGHSISLYENTLMVGAHSIDMSNFYYDENSNLKIDDYFIGTSTSVEESMKVGDEQINLTQCKVHF